MPYPEYFVAPMRQELVDLGARECRTPDEVDEVLRKRGTAVIVGIAAFNLLIDFDVIEHGIREGAPGWMSWFAAFGLMVTVVWLYLEILRLLALTRD